MKLLRKLGWTFLLLSSGVAGGCAPPAAAPPPPAGAPAPPQPHPAQLTPVDDRPAAWPWFLEEEDEFEGEGWGFWGR